jgi:hypothetical protein
MATTVAGTSAVTITAAEAVVEVADTTTTLNAATIDMSVADQAEAAAGGVTALAAVAAPVVMNAVEELVEVVIGGATSTAANSSAAVEAGVGMILGRLKLIFSPALC